MILIFAIISLPLLGFSVVLGGFIFKLMILRLKAVSSSINPNEGPICGNKAFLFNYRLFHAPIPIRHLLTQVTVATVMQDASTTFAIVTTQLWILPASIRVTLRPVHRIRKPVWMTHRHTVKTPSIRIIILGWARQFQSAEVHFEAVASFRWHFIYVANAFSYEVLIIGS